MLAQRPGLAASPPLLYTFKMGRRTASPFRFSCRSLRQPENVPLSPACVRARAGVRAPHHILRLLAVRSACWSDVVEVDQVHVLASAVLCNLEEVLDAGESAFTRETRRDLLKRDRNDRVHFDLPALDAVSPAGSNARADPDPDGSRDCTTPDPVAQVFRELHRTSLRSCHLGRRLRSATSDVARALLPVLVSLSSVDTGASAGRSARAPSGFASTKGIARRKEQRRALARRPSNREEC